MLSPSVTRRTAAHGASLHDVSDAAVDPSGIAEQSRTDHLSSSPWTLPRERGAFHDSCSFRGGFISAKAAAPTSAVYSSAAPAGGVASLVSSSSPSAQVHDSQVLLHALRCRPRQRRHLRRFLASWLHGRSARFWNSPRCFHHTRCIHRRCRTGALGLFLVVVVLLCTAALVWWHWGPGLVPYDVPPPYPLLSPRDPLSVVVGHGLHAPPSSASATAASGTQEADHCEVSDKDHKDGDDVDVGDSARVGVLTLPSWTLHVVDTACTSCLDTHTYTPALRAALDRVQTLPSAAAVQTPAVAGDPYRPTAVLGDAELQNAKTTAEAADERDTGFVADRRRLLGDYAVFATTAAPLGRIGPMLLAMSSVTDDVGVEQELPRWAWVESSFPAAAVGAAARFRSPTHHRDGHHRSHRRLAVLGIPSTDQPARLALREAQRATWLTYTGVARASNHFDGAVLPLYIFAASDDASRPSSSAAFFPRPPPSPAPPLPAAGDAQGPPAGARELVHPIAEHRQPGSNDTNNPHRNRGSNRHTDADAVDAEGAAKPTPMTAALLPTETELRCASRFYRIGGDATLAPPPASQSPPQQPQQPQRKPLSYPRRVFELTSGARRTILVRSSNQDVAAACGARRQVEPKVPPTSVDTTAVLNIEGNSKDDARLHDGVCGGVRQILVSGLTSPAIPTAATHPSVKGTPPAPHHFSPLASLGQQLRLPVTPAFVAPAEFVCYASASLWQEALEHRNVLWIDMMTDRRPTTNKTLGGTGDWGLPTEIGMTQKSVLWFYYAYHAFPDVPYIMKGDDDTYLKVPQFMSDWHMLRTGHREPALEARASPPFHTSPSRSFIVNTLANLTRTPLGGAVTYGIAEPSLEEEECLYWGATRVFLDRIAFNPGPLYALQRRLVQTALETLPDRDPNRDVLRLAAEDYDPARLPWYAYNVMQNEDAAFGKLMKERGERARQVCPRRRWWTVREVSPRFHDVHRGKTETVTWATMAVHRCTPADYYFLHYYFATEYLAALRSPTDTTPENAQEVEAARWAKAHLRGRVRGWDSLPNVSWCYNPSTDPSFIVSDEDGVALYDIPYEAWDEARTSVVTGGTSRLRMGKGFFASLFSMLT